jgi:hypothetical protein
MLNPVRRRRRHRSREEIATILSAFDQSGQSAVAFARREKLALSTLRLWLSRRGTARVGRRQVPLLIPVTLPTVASAVEPPFEVMLTNGRVLRFARGLGPDELAAVCEALERPCSR